VCPSIKLSNSLTCSKEMALIAKAAHKPFYAAAERYVVVSKLMKVSPESDLSYKFHRLFPLSQYELDQTLKPVFTTPKSDDTERDLTKKGEHSEMIHSNVNCPVENPEVDYTRYVACYIMGLGDLQHAYQAGSYQPGFLRCWRFDPIRSVTIFSRNVCRMIGSEVVIKKIRVPNILPLSNVQM
jgi:hypothetical protein